MSALHLLGVWLLLSCVILGMLWLSRCRREEQTDLDMTDEDWADFKAFQERHKSKPKGGR
jgi:hypothetical protein